MSGLAEKPIIWLKVATASWQEKTGRTRLKSCTETFRPASHFQTDFLDWMPALICIEYIGSRFVELKNQ